MKNEAQIKKTLTSNTQSPLRIKGGGRKVLNEEMELEVYNWIISMRCQHFRVTRTGIQQKALEIMGSESGFKGSNGWLQNFMKRFDLSLRRRTHVSQRLPKDVEDKTLNFFIFLRQYLLAYQIEEVDIIACDQTPFYFDNVGPSTIEKMGAKSVSLKSTGHEKNNFTVMLSACSNGKKKKP